MSDNSTSGGVGFSGLLQISFIILKLCHVIAWSWWWIMSPTWIGVALVLIILYKLAEFQELSLDIDHIEFYQP